MGKNEKDCESDVRGSIEMLLLVLLNDGDKYGYQMMQELRSRTNNKVAVHLESMYAVLYRLADDGCVTFKEKQVGKRKIRVYYHLTDKGRKRMTDLIKAFRKHNGVVESLLKNVTE